MTKRLLKTLSFGAAHNYIAHVVGAPPSPPPTSWALGYSPVLAGNASLEPGPGHGDKRLRRLRDFGVCHVMSSVGHVLVRDEQ